MHDPKKTAPAVTNASPDVATRCRLCRLPSRWCVCAFAPTLSTQHAVTLLVHQIEWRKLSNTGHLVRKTFADQKILVQGRPGKILEHSDIVAPNRANYVLFPGQGARPLEEIPEADKKKGINLIVPDGNWGQTSRMLKRILPLADIPRVMLTADAPAHRRMRINISSERMSTFEAIALAIHQIDENSDIDQAMHFFRLYADRLLMLRGKIKASEMEAPMGESENLTLQH